MLRVQKSCIYVLFNVFWSSPIEIKTIIGSTPSVKILNCHVWYSKLYMYVCIVYFPILLLQWLCYLLPCIVSSHASHSVKNVLQTTPKTAVESAKPKEVKRKIASGKTFSFLFTNLSIYCFSVKMSLLTILLSVSFTVVWWWAVRIVICSWFYFHVELFTYE